MLGGMDLFCFFFFFFKKKKGAEPGSQLELVARREGTMSNDTLPCSGVCLPVSGNQPTTWKREPPYVHRPHRRACLRSLRRQRAPPLPRKEWDAP